MGVIRIGVGNREEYLKNVKHNFSLGYISGLFDKLKELNILVIGDTIIDQYVFVRPKGRAVKDPILSTAYEYDEKYGGGIIAIANHVSDFVSSVKLVTLLGGYNSKRDFVESCLKPNTSMKVFTKPNTPTTTKKRFIDVQRNNKLFKIEYMNDKPIPEQLSHEVEEYLMEEVPKYDLVIVGDFGHGFINDRIRHVLEIKSNFLSLNAQSNSSNMGYNYFTLYKNVDFMCCNDEELRLPLSMRFSDIDLVINRARTELGKNRFLVTQSKEGCTFVHGEKSFKGPVMTLGVKDTVGAGDALFALASLMVAIDADDALIPFIANCAGGLAANIMGNKEPITRDMLEGFIREVLK